MHTRLAAIVVALFAFGAFAQSDPFARGIDLVPIKLTPTMSSGLTLEGGELNYRGSWQAQAFLDMNVGLLALKLGDRPLGDLLPFRADLHLTGAFQVHPRVEVSADIPIALQFANFGLMTQQGFPQDNPNVLGLGAPRLLARAQVLSQRELPIVGLAAVLEMRVPIGDTFSFLSDRGFVFAPRLAVERNIGPVRLVGNLGWRLRTAPGQYLNLFVGQEFMTGVGGSLELPAIWRFNNNEVWGEVNIVTPAEAPFTFSESEALKTPFELMIGARTKITNELGLMAAFGRGLGLQNGYGRETFRFTVGVRYEHFTEPDQDGDGIPDSKDACVDVPEDKDGFEDLDGCPEPGPDLDTDGDGIPDSVDGCPTEPGPMELDGCPDRDGDQIPDNVDKCPDEPGTPDLEGCPPPEEEEEVVLESERVRINNQILFEFGSDRIDPRSFKLLDEVAKVLTLNPDVGPVLIEGHTDNIGTRAYNLDLSKRRAKAVENYLISKGIAPKRLRSDGFGFDRPIAPNDNAINRAKNRRTEFRLVDESKEGDKAGGGNGAKDSGGGAKKDAPKKDPPKKPEPPKKTGAAKPPAPAPAPPAPAPAAPKPAGGLK